MPAAPATTLDDVCLYYRPGALCFNVELDVNTIAVVLATGVSIYLAIKTGVVSSSNKDKGDQEVEIKDEKTGDKFYGDCASAYAEETALLADCGSAQSKWIEVPTGASFALESVYYYDKSGTGGTNAWLKHARSAMSFYSAISSIRGLWVSSRLRPVDRRLVRLARGLRARPHHRSRSHQVNRAGRHRAAQQGRRWTDPRSCPDGHEAGAVATTESSQIRRTSRREVAA
jgi:hypothetical protein